MTAEERRVMRVKFCLWPDVTALLDRIDELERVAEAAAAHIKAGGMMNAVRVQEALIVAGYLKEGT